MPALLMITSMSRRSQPAPMEIFGSQIRKRHSQLAALLAKLLLPETSPFTVLLADTPSAIVSGPDGNLWATESSHVAKITTSGTLTDFPQNIFVNFSLLEGITSGPDGNLWFTAINNSKLANSPPVGI